MWKQLRPTHATVILNTEFEDFASIEVEKINTKNTSISHYVIGINIYDITEQSVDVYKNEDIERVLRCVKNAIEELYEEIAEYSQEDIEDWVDHFCDLLTEIQ